MHRVHTRACMHNFDDVYPEYTFEAVRMHYTLEAVGPLRAYMCIHSYVNNLLPV